MAKKLIVSNIKERISDRWPEMALIEALKAYPAEIMAMCRCIDDAATLEKLVLDAGLL